MTILKLNLLFIWNMVRFNPIKVVIILSTVFSIKAMISYPKDTIIHQSISGPVYVDSDTLYLGQLIKDYKNPKRSEVHKYEAIKYSSSYLIRGNKIFSNETNDVISFWFWASLVFLFLSTLLSFTIDDEDNESTNPSWEVNRNFRRSKSKFIDCEKEGDIYYYTVKDRLVHESSWVLSEREIHSLSWSFNNLNYLPKFKTKRKWRDHAIKNLGID
jgi:hypothetical protein